MMIRSQTLLRLASATALAAAAFGCGSGDSTTGSPAQMPPAADTAAGAGSGGSAPRTGLGSTPAPGSNAAAAGGGVAMSRPAAAGGGAGAGGAAATPSGTGSEKVPCDVSKVLAKNCGSCHGSTPIGGAPMPLVTYADLHKAAATKPELKVFELAKQRINDKAKPMPPGGAISAEDLSALNQYLGAGAVAASATDACAKPASGTGEPSTSTMEPLVALPGETCYEFKTHASMDSIDNMPYDVKNGEHYANFYFKAPWPDGTVATRYGAKYDNLKVLHHWLLFSTSEDQVEGAHTESPLPTLLGVNATLLAGWAVGGVNLEMPKDVGFELPKKGEQLNIQWHFYNSTNTPQADMSAVQICTVPAGTRPHIASMTWVGTEDLGGNKWFGGAGMPPHQMSTFEGTCDPLREGMKADEPIHIIAFWPHMHQLGTRMQTYVNHKNGMRELIFDKPFDFNHQIHYMQPYDLMPGDTLSAVCNYNNTTNAGVPFGESSDTEMCYQFTFSWPAHALENHVVSLIGATNTCW